MSQRTAAECRSDGALFDAIDQQRMVWAKSFDAARLLESATWLNDWMDIVANRANGLDADNHPVRSEIRNCISALPLASIAKGQLQLWVDAIGSVLYESADDIRKDSPTTARAIERQDLVWSPLDKLICLLCKFVLSESMIVTIFGAALKLCLVYGVNPAVDLPFSVCVERLCNLFQVASKLTVRAPRACNRVWTQERYSDNMQFIVHQFSRLRQATTQRSEMRELVAGLASLLEVHLDFLPHQFASKFGLVSHPLAPAKGGPLKSGSISSHDQTWREVHAVCKASDSFPAPCQLMCFCCGRPGDQSRKDRAESTQGLQRCGGCKSVFYSSRECVLTHSAFGSLLNAYRCQVLDWRAGGHKAACKLLAMQKDANSASLKSSEI